MSHDVTLNNLVYCKRFRIIKTLNELTLHLLREDGLGGLWNVDGSLKLAAITKSH
jgi:hypothetical protein